MAAQSTAAGTQGGGTSAAGADEEQAVEAAVEKAVEQAMAVPGQTAAAADKTPAAPAPAPAATDKTEPRHTPTVAGPAVYRAGDVHGLQGAAVRLGVRPSVVVGAMVHASLSEATLQQLRTAVETFLAAPVR